jgi:hypothetical protein
MGLSGRPVALIELRTGVPYSEKLIDIQDEMGLRLSGERSACLNFVSTVRRPRTNIHREDVLSIFDKSRRIGPEPVGFCTMVSQEKM